MFLGTPFRGSEDRQFAHLVGMAGDIMGLAKYTDLIRSSKSGSFELDGLANDFLGDSRKALIDLVCYYETENTMSKPEWDIGKIFKPGVIVQDPGNLVFTDVLVGRHCQQKVIYFRRLPKFSVGPYTYPDEQIQRS